MEQMTVKSLKEELRNRGASVRGKKADLYARLVAYEENNNFKLDVYTEQVKPNFDVPTDNIFRDINANSELPALTRQHIDLFLQRFNVDGQTGENMYKERFLGHIRQCKMDGVYFFKSVVHAQMYKKLQYSVSLKVSPDGIILGSHCECAAGEGGAAHCKHVVVCLLAVEDMANKKSCITRQVCTQELQSFHKPKKSYQGTPLKASSLKQENRKLSYSFDPRPTKFRNLDTNSRVKNLLAPYETTAPLKTVIKPANPYALDVDHNYSCVPRQVQFLKALQLKDVTEEDVLRIEHTTRGQSKNSHWHECRKIRITASNFYDCCVVKTDDARVNLAKRLLNPTKVVSDALIHGITNEDKAVKAFMATKQGQLQEKECGLFIMESRPYLGASPDRLLAEVTILEVKCPYTARDSTINEFTVPYLVKKDGDLTLNPEDKYMYQVQGQLAVTGKEFCDFIVFTNCDMKVISISRDESFICDMLSKLDAFYEKYFLPELLNKYYYKRYGDIF